MLDYYLLKVLIYTFYCFKNKDFRPLFGHLAEICSILPSGTPFMACTATVTKTVCKEIIQSLEMIDYVCVGVSPNQSNIYDNIENSLLHIGHCHDCFSNG